MIPMGRPANRVLNGLMTRGGRPLLFAHRGDSFHAPENTLEAARLAHQTGAFAWELDVQPTRDGVLIVIHDDELERTTDVAIAYHGDPRCARGFRVCDFDWAEIAALDAGSWFVALDGGPRSARDFGTLESISDARRSELGSGRVRVPTLTQALELTRELDWLVNVEIKACQCDPGSLAAAVLAAVAEAGMGDRVLISSFDHALVAASAALPGDHAVGLLSTTAGHGIVYVAASLGAHTLNLGSRALGMSRGTRSDEDQRLLAELAGREMPLLVYTVNDHAPGGLADRLADLGASAIFTDDPGSRRISDGPG